MWCVVGCECCRQGIALIKSSDYIPRYAVEMKKKPIDIIDIKKAVADGQLVAFEKDYQIFLKDRQTGEVVKIGDKEK